MLHVAPMRCWPLGVSWVSELPARDDQIAVNARVDEGEHVVATGDVIFHTASDVVRSLMDLAIGRIGSRGVGRCSHNACPTKGPWCRFGCPATVGAKRRYSGRIDGAAADTVRSWCRDSTINQMPNATNEIRSNKPLYHRAMSLASSASAAKIAIMAAK